MYRIHSPAIKLLAVHELISMSHKKQSPVIEALRNASPQELQQLSNSLEVSIDPTRIEKNLEGKEFIDSESAHLQYFMSNGATIRMIQDFFPHLGRNQIREIRRTYSDGGARPKRVGGKQSIAILAAWSDLLRKIFAHDAERLIALHTQFNDLALSSIYVVLQESE